jgi:hypothetical protein
LIVQISNGPKNQYVGVTKDGQVMQWNDPKYAWDYIDLPKPNMAKQVSMGSDGDMYALNTAGEVFHRFENSWTKIDGNCTQIDVANKDSVMCVNGTGKLLNKTATEWMVVPAPAPLTQISISSNKQAVALDDLGNTYFKSFLTPSWNWSLIPDVKFA